MGMVPTVLVAKSIEGSGERVATEYLDTAHCKRFLAYGKVYEIVEHTAESMQTSRNEKRPEGVAPERCVQDQGDKGTDPTPVYHRV